MVAALAEESIDTAGKLADWVDAGEELTELPYIRGREARLLRAALKRLRDGQQEPSGEKRP